MTSPARTKLSVAECDRMICQPGGLFELEEITINGVKVRSWKHQYPSYRAFLMDKMEAHGDQVFINAPRPEPAPENARETITYAETYRQAVQLAAWLRERGVRVEDHIGLVGFNSIGWVVAWVAIHLAGAVPVMVNSALQMDSMLHCLKITHPKIILADAVSANALTPYADKLKGMHCGEVYSWQNADHLEHGKRIKTLDFSTMESRPEAVQDVLNGTGLEGLGPDSNGTIFFTSGTTGYPKAVLASQRAGLHNLISYMIPPLRMALRAGVPLDTAMEVVTGPPAVRTVGLMAVPFFHGTGCLAWLAKGIYDGVQLVLMRRWSVKDAVDLILEHKVNYIGGVPAIAVAIIQSGRIPKDWPMKAVSYGGAPPPARLADDVRANFPETTMGGHGWGMTETTVLHTTHLGADYYEKPKSCGPPVPVCEVRIVDENKRVLPAGEVGQIQAKGPNIMKEYYGNPKATAEALDKDGWLDTGDAGYLDDEGCLYIADRIKDIIIRGGENIPSEEVENAIYLDDRVAEAASVPVPDEYLGELVAVAVSLVPGKSAAAESIMSAVAPRLRRDARPVFVHVAKGLLPRNINGKLVKADIKKTVQAEYARLKAAEQQPRAKL